MKESWLTADLRNMPKFLFFLILILYPLFSIVVYEGIGMNINFVFGLVCLCFLIFRIYSIYWAGYNLRIPYYIIIFGIFITYAILCNIFVSIELKTEGAVKYLYSNAFLATFIAFLVCENTNFPPKWIKFAINVLGLTLILSAIVSVIQISKPLFLIKDDYFIPGLSFERLTEYYNNHGKERMGLINRFLNGYRFSIYSYINATSVGIDSLAILSLLIALKANHWIKTVIWVIAAAFVSFLSSSRWIMLNFLIIVSQNIWLTKNKILNIIKYGVFGISLMLILIPALKFLGIDIQQFIEGRLTDNSANTRIIAFEVFFKVYPDNPIFGTGGVDTAKMQQLLGGRSSQIHVGYLKLFYYYGLVGGCLYLAFLVSLLVRLWKRARESDYWGGFFAILAFAIANLTLVVFDLFYYGLLLALIFSNHFYNENRKSADILQTKKITDSLRGKRILKNISAK